MGCARCSVRVETSTLQTGLHFPLLKRPAPYVAFRGGKNTLRTCIVRPISVPAPALKLLLPRTYEVRVFLLLRSVVLIVLLLYTPEFSNYSDYSTILNLINLVLGS